MRTVQSSFPLESLSNLVEINIGKTPARKESEYWKGDHPWVAISDMKGSKYIEFTKEGITQQGITNSNIKIVPEQTIIFSYKLSIGKVAITRKPLYTNEAIAAFPILDIKRVDLGYLYFVLREFDFTDGGDRAVMGKTLNKAKLKELQIPLPSFSEQQKIAETLDAADALRQKDQQLIDHYTALSQSLFLDMFGDPVTNPMCWERKNLSEIVQSVIDCPHSTPRWSDKGKVAVRTSNLTKGGWNWNDKRFVTEEEFHDRSKRAFVKEGDIILSREGTIGVLAIVLEGMEICLGQRLVQLIPNFSIADNKYLLSLLLFELDPKRISRAMVGATSKHLNVKELRSMKLPLPPIELQNQFADRIALIEKQKQQAEASLAQSNNLFNSLLQKAFTGELTQQSERAA